MVQCYHGDGAAYSNYHGACYHGDGAVIILVQCYHGDGAALQ